MINKNELDKSLNQTIQKMLAGLQIEQEKKPLRLALQFGYLMYVRLFIESQKKEMLQPYFPYAGFPMEWSRGEEPMEAQQRIWQLQYQVQYCASIVEEGHFMESAEVFGNISWLEALCRLIDEMYDCCDWEKGMPEIFGIALDQMIKQIYAMGTSGMFLIPDVLTEMMIQLSDFRVHAEVWNPSCRTGALLAALYKKFPNWSLEGSEEEKEQCLLAQMLQFFHGVSDGRIICENALEKDKQYQYDLIVSNPPVGELRMQDQERFPIATRKIHLQYLQMCMEHLKPQGQAIIVLNEGTLFKFDAEKKVRETLFESFNLQGVISLPAGAFLPYTSGKASILIFKNSQEEVSDDSSVWFYELNQVGYSLDKRQEATDGSQIPELLKTWKRRKEMEAEWKHQMLLREKKNQWNNPVPGEWKEASCWFADRKTIRQNDYNITAGRYKPWREEAEEEIESPIQLLRQLMSMEQETVEQMKELIEMTKHYE